MLWFHGIGIYRCRARGHVRWGRRTRDYDAVEWVGFFLLPVIPVRALHVAHESSSPFVETDIQTREWPIRWSPSLLARSFVNRWLWLFFLCGLLFGLVFLFHRLPPAKVMGLILATFCLTIFYVSRWLLRRADRRTQAIRILLGRHSQGSSDPIHWRPSRFTDGVRPEAIYGTSSFAEAVPVYLSRREYSRAMWAARLCCALESQTVGEELTDSILADPQVQLALARVQERPDLWERLLVLGETPMPRLPSGTPEELLT